MLSLEAEDYEMLGWGSEINFGAALDEQLNIRTTYVATGAPAGNPNLAKARAKSLEVRRAKAALKPPKPPGPGRGKWKRPQTDPERIREVREHAARLGVEAFNKFLAVGNL